MTLDASRGTGIDFLRRLTRGRGLEAQLLEQLTPEEIEVYRTTLAFNWVPAVTIARIMPVAARVLFPERSDGVAEIGRLMAHDHMKGVYRILMRVATVNMVLDQTARLWETYHRTGKATATHDAKARTGQLIVVDYPELPGAVRTGVGGFILGLIELTGAKGPAVFETPSDPARWIWDVSYW